MNRTPDPDAEFASVADLAVALGWSGTDEDEIWALIERYAENYLEHDRPVSLDWMDSAPDGSITSLSLSTRRISMWAFTFPTTMATFHEYLDEMDRRIERMMLLEAIPVPEDPEIAELDPETLGAIALALADIFEVSIQQVFQELGVEWTVLDSQEGGWASNPVRYLRLQGQVVLGIDDAYLHLFEAGHGSTVRGGTASKDFVLDLDTASFDDLIAMIADVKKRPRTAGPRPPRR